MNQPRSVIRPGTSPGVLSYFLPRTQDALFICILLVVCIRGSDLFNADGDLGRHITIGKYIIDHGIPFANIFSHTLAGQYLVSHEWLAQVLFGAAHALMGLSGPVLLTAILIATTVTLIYQETLKRNTHYLPALLITTLAAFTSIIHWLARPHIFTFLFTALWTYSLQKIMDGKQNKIWVFPLLMVIWANTHGAFISGFVTLAAYFAGWLWEYLSGETDITTGKKLALIAISSLAVTFINPYGWHLWGTSAGYFGNQYLRDYTIEYQSPNFHEFSGIPFMLMLMLGFIAPALGRKLRAHEAFLFAGWCALSLYSKRNIPLFAIITAPYLAYMFQPVFEKLAISKRIERTIQNMEAQLKGNSITLPVIAILLMFVALQKGIPIDSTGLGYRYDPQKFPVQAVDWLETNPQDGKMFNYFLWGGYLLYRDWPQQKVFIDGQTDFYGEALTVEYASVAYLQGNWQDVLSKYDIAWAIIQSKDDKLVKAFQDALHWKIIYQDDTATILHRP